MESLTSDSEESINGTLQAGPSKTSSIDRYCSKLSKIKLSSNG